MLKVNAEDYVKVGEGFARIKPDLDPPEHGWFERNAPLMSDEKKGAFFDNLSAISTHCRSLQLDVTSGLIERVVEIDKGSGGLGPSVKDAYVFMEGLTKTFKVELDQQMFFYVLPHRAPYFGGSGGSPDDSGREARELLEAVAPFPETAYDTREAASCFAFERFTASVYHLMRVAEHGLVAVALAADVPPAEHRSWDKMISGIGRHIKVIESQSKDGWMDERKKFSDLCSWFTTVKSGWRNPVSHIPRVYSEATARGMFTAIRTLFEHLSHHNFVGATMPRSPIALPDEDDA